MQEVAPLKLSLKNYEVKPLPTGVFGLDGGAMFGTVPKILWERTNPADPHNRIDLEARGLLLSSKDRIVVIDTGNGGDFVAKYGEKLGGKFAQIYNISTQAPAIIPSLSKHGVTPDKVTDVILTHLHFDHAGGATTAREGKLVPTFPKAKYYVQKSNLETAKTPNAREKASYFSANFQPLLEAGVLNLVEGAKEILPGISVGVSNGHTKGHQFVKVTDGEKTIVFCGDVIPTSSHIRLAWIMGYDLDPLKIIDEKRELLTEAAQKGWYLFFEHDPYCDLATVEADGADFAVKKRFKIS